MTPETYSHHFLTAAALPPAARHTNLATLHQDIVGRYTAALHALTAEQAAVVVADDGRTTLQVVGHIMAWERFIILAAGDMLAGVQRPRLAFGFTGYIAEDGSSMQFDGIDAFNNHFATQHAPWSWAAMQTEALRTAHTLHTLFTHPHLLTADRLEQTAPSRIRLPNGERINPIGAGWMLWNIVLEHEAVEHARELAIGY